MRNEEQRDVVVVGAGLAGLTAAATAAGGGASVTVVDGNHAGGRASTDQVGRYRFNRGARALRRGSVGRAVLDRLGVTVSASAPENTDAHGSIGDRIGLLPWGEEALARTDLIDEADKPGLAEAYAGIGRWSLEELGTRSARAWFDELGLGPSARRFLEAQQRLETYIVDLNQVSADLVAGQLRLDPVVDYLHGGWARLVDQLVAAARSRGAQLSVGDKVRSAVPEGDRVRVETAARTLLARQVVVAAGTPAANASLLPEQPSSWQQLGPAVTAASLDLGLTRIPPEIRFLQGLDQPLYLSRHAPPADLAPTGGSVVHLMRYLDVDEQLSPQKARQQMLDHARLAGIGQDDIEEARYLHRMVVVGATPRPEQGGLTGQPRVTDTGHEGVLVAGDWVGPEGHLADASLSSGETAGRIAAAAAELAPRTYTLA